ncbi:hypothetical protein BOSEA31B_11489 [Hyphomicrobiales bacterium]|nr:hypothetical protein BOSEA31B_11489 [Hyphomicrobiales bacterium]CAH1697285.1 hypothetical protein BOSEA1005_10322 [Hyphomicrobiales bacterium]CAI0342852.1 hypothetical protein BO1005MUT1_10145 [Hyphomicrobiales bacterium]
MGRTHLCARGSGRGCVSPRLDGATPDPCGPATVRPCASCLWLTDRRSPLREHAAHEASRDGSIGIGKQHLEIMQERSERCAFAAVFLNQLDQFPLDCVFIVVVLGWLRCHDFCPHDENKIGTKAKLESRRQWPDPRKVRVRRPTTLTSVNVSQRPWRYRYEPPERSLGR